MRFLAIVLSLMFLVSSSVYGSCADLFALNELRAEPVDDGDFVAQLSQRLFTAFEEDVRTLSASVQPEQLRKMQAAMKNLRYLPDDSIYDGTVVLGGLLDRRGLIEHFSFLRALKGHPISAVVLRHEFQHLFTFSAMGRLELATKSEFFRSFYVLGFEEDAFGAQYDFIRKNISLEDVETFKSVTGYLSDEELKAFQENLGWVNRPIGIEDVMTAMAQSASHTRIASLLVHVDFRGQLEYLRSVPIMDKLLIDVQARKLDFMFVELVDSAMYLSREEYIDKFLENYRKGNFMTCDPWFKASFLVLSWLNIYFRAMTWWMSP